MSKRSLISGPVKAPSGHYPKLLRLLDQYFLKEAIPDRAAVSALDTLVRINQAVLDRPDSVNLRCIRMRELGIRQLIDYGGGDILTEMGWQFRISGMEETWHLAYDADVAEVLQSHVGKLVDAQKTLQRRLAATRQEAVDVVRREKETKASIVRQIEQNLADKKQQQAMRKGEAVPVKQSLDEIRKQAVKERLARQKKQQEEADAALESVADDQDRSGLPGSFPQDAEVSKASRGPQSGFGYDHPDDEPEDDLNDDNDDESDSDISSNARRPSRVMRTGGRSHGGPGPVQRPRRAQPKPIEVKKKEAPKERYEAGTHTLGGTPAD
jgi:hypothetical protein